MPISSLIVLQQRCHEDGPCVGHRGTMLFIHPMGKLVNELHFCGYQNQCFRPVRPKKTLSPSTIAHRAEPILGQKTQLSICWDCTAAESVCHVPRIFHDIRRLRLIGRRTTLPGPTESHLQVSSLTEWQDHEPNTDKFLPDELASPACRLAGTR